MEGFARTDRRKREDRLGAMPKNIDEIIQPDEYNTPKKDADELPEIRPAAQDRSLSPRYMSPLVDEATADKSVFAERGKKKGKVYRTELDARAFVGRQIQAYGLNYGQVASYFESIMTKKVIYENDLLDIVKTIYDDFDNGRLASNY